MDKFVVSFVVFVVLVFGSLTAFVIIPSVQYSERVKAACTELGYAPVAIKGSWRFCEKDDGTLMRPDLGDE